jgi:hypothetical protein
MSKEPIDDKGIPMSIYHSFIPDELPYDAVGLWQIVPEGRSRFHLTGSDLVDFVRGGIHALLDAGAVPVRFGGGTGFNWVAQKQYGTEKVEITEAVIKEWLALPVDPVVLFSQAVWFARPDPDSRFVKID